MGSSVLGLLFLCQERLIHKFLKISKFHSKKLAKGNINDIYLLIII